MLIGSISRCGRWSNRAAVAVIVSAFDVCPRLLQALQSTTSSTTALGRRAVYHCLLSRYVCMYLRYKYVLSFHGCENQCEVNASRVSCRCGRKWRCRCRCRCGYRCCVCCLSGSLGGAVLYCTVLCLLLCDV